MKTQIIIGALGLLGLGGVLGYYLRHLRALATRGSIELEIKQILIDAKEEANKITDEARRKAEEKEEEVRTLERETSNKLKHTETRLIKKEELLDARQTEIDREGEHLKMQAEDIRRIKEKVEMNKLESEDKLEKIARLTISEARDEILRKTENLYSEDILSRMHKLERDGEERLTRRAKEIMATTIERLASSTANEFMTTTVTLPSEDIKGKIIGKEGRNIRTFEREAGVELIVDDTPGAIIISSFDPIRRHIASLALQNLIKDGRIQPAKIEEMILRAKEEIQKTMKEEGEKAVFECGLFNLDPRVVSVLGRLHFRTSYGQNVLKHSIEMTHIAGMLASELGGDVAIAKAGALVHDIGKALDHEVEGTHIDIGIRILQKYNTDKRIIDAMKSHHNDYPHESIEAVIVQTADHISGGRPGARRDTAENYLKRLGELEALVNSFPGIEKSYALQAGREIRIFVSPEKVTDIEAKKMTKSIADKIEKELKYPGEIKVTLIRENRVVEYAR